MPILLLRIALRSVGFVLGGLATVGQAAAGAADANWLIGTWGEVAADHPPSQLTVTTVDTGGNARCLWNTPTDFVVSGLMVHNDSLALEMRGGGKATLTRQGDELVGAIETDGQSRQIRLHRGLVAIDSPPQDFPRPRADSTITVVNIGAMNCPPCVAFTNNVEPGWKASAEIGQVRYEHVWAASYKNMSDDYYWQSADLRALRDQAKVRNFAPQFIVALDGKVLLDTWKWVDVHTLITELIAEKTIARASAR